MTVKTKRRFKTAAIASERNRKTTMSSNGSFLGVCFFGMNYDFIWLNFSNIVGFQRVNFFIERSSALLFASLKLSSDRKRFSLVFCN